MGGSARARYAAHSADAAADRDNIYHYCAPRYAAACAASAAKDTAAELQEQTKRLFQYLNRPVAESLELASEKLRCD